MLVEHLSLVGYGPTPIIRVESIAEELLRYLGADVLGYINRPTLTTLYLYLCNMEPTSPKRTYNVV